MRFLHASNVGEYRGQLVGAQHLEGRPRGAWGRQGVLPSTILATATVMSNSLDACLQVQRGMLWALHKAFGSL